MKTRAVYDLVHRNCYLTVAQKCMLQEISRIMKCPQTEFLKEALYFYFRERVGVDDGVICDGKDLERELERGMKSRD